MNQNKTNVLVVRFSNHLALVEIPYFRGAVLAALGNQTDLLFHNHINNGFRYAYPLIQYKSIHGKAVIVCIGEGTESIGNLFTHLHEPLKIGNREMILELENIKSSAALIQIWDANFSYSLRKWLPLNQENSDIYERIDDMKERVLFFEKILTGNILSFAKGLGIHFGKQVTCSITRIEEKGAMRYKKINFETFDIEFCSNVSLPNFIGLGKGVSHGFGTCVQINDRCTVQNGESNNDNE
jgi:hypothetical protein